MHASSLRSNQGRWSRSPVVLLALGAAVLASACGGSAGSSGQSGIVGSEELKPGGGTFFVDENGSGGRANVHLAEVLWGRLVDVHEIDANGQRVEDPVFRDFVVEASVLTNGASYVLDRNPVTQRERLTIQAQKRGVADTTAFDDLLSAATDALPVVSAKNIGGAPPFSSIPRNGCLVLRIDDCLDDSTTAAANLPETVRVLSGYPPITPFSARIVFDPNHGAVVRGAFHSTRVLIDMTTSESEAAALPGAQGVNPVGLPASLAASPSSNVAVRVPTRVDVGSGQFEVLTNLSGVPLDEDTNGPSDPGVPTLDIVRAVRSGNSDDPSNGFLTDVDRPRVVGGWPVTVDDADFDPAGDAGFDFLIDFDFDTTCLNAPAVGDVLSIGEALLEVTEAGALVGSSVTDLKARSALSITNPLTLVGAGLYQAPFQPSLALANGCWVSFLPEATNFPADGVSTSAQILLRFSEPMDPATLSPFGDFLVVNGAAGASTSATAHNILVGEVVPSNDLTLFAFEPVLPMRHTANDANDRKHIELDQPRDLAGNRLRNQLPFVEFRIEPAEPTQSNGAIVLRFDANDEYENNDGDTDGLPDLRGQFFYDSQRGSIFPRAVATTGWPADRTNPVPNRMTRLTAGLSLPLNPLGAKVQTLWRYCDFGWNASDETKFNLDVVGLSWSPFAGGVQADFFELFEIRLGHSRFLPDEPVLNSGLPAGTPFEGNYLAGSNPKVVHNRTLGYTVNPSLRFSTTTGSVMMPYPLNLGSGTDVTYTWRDTAILSVGADGGAGNPGAPGIPLQAEADAGVIPGPSVGSLFGRTLVPSFGLPLLIEFKCFPSDSGLGINGLDASLANATVGPAFRALSAGGINSLGNPTPVLPESALTPSGGFANGLTTAPVDNVFYVGQLDTVVRVSRVHTVWLDTGLPGNPSWQAPILEPTGANQPTGTSVELGFRSASGFSGVGTPTAPFNATALNAYGNQSINAPTQLSADWSSDITLHDNKRFLQVRISFINNTAAGVSPELTAMALPFLE
jgi:hypothetical protein